MSIFGALNASVTGLQAQSDSLGIISDNIANVNTTGYKTNKANFQALVTSAPTSTSFNPGGTQLRPTQEVGKQGILNSSDINTDLAVDGNGFFAVKDAAGDVDANTLEYTRAGSFRVNDEGNLENANGFLLQGWRLTENAAGELTPPADQQSPQSLDTVNVSGFSGIARATQNLDIGANLPPNLPVSESRELSARIFDSEGTPHNVRFEFSRDRGDGTALDANQFRVDINAPTLANAEDNAQSGLFDLNTTGSGPVDLTSTRGQFVQKIADNFEGQSTAGPATATIDGINFGVPNSVDTSGNGILERSELLNAGNNEIILDPGGANVNISDLDLNNLIRETINQAGAAIPAGAVVNNGDTVDVNILGTNERVRLQTQDGSRIDGGTALAPADVDNATVVQIDEDGDQNFDAGTDKKLINTDNSTPNTFDKSTRLSTVVQFAGDGSIQAIGNDLPSGNVNSSLATDFLADKTKIVSDVNGEIPLNVSFPEQVNSTPSGTDADEPTTLNLNLGTPRDPDGNGVEENEKQLDGLTSFDNPDGFQVNEVEQDGLQFGNFTGVSVNEDGVVIANFSNGERREVFQTPVVTFNNPNGLEQQTGTTFRETPDSGNALLNEAGLGGAGTVAPSSLEDSTVELSQQFTNMIQTQRAYSANTRVVTTSDEMLQEITNATR